MTTRFITAYIVSVIVGAVIALLSPITSPAQWLILPGAYLAFGLVCWWMSRIARRPQ